VLVFISDSNVGPDREIGLFVLAPPAVALVAYGTLTDDLCLLAARIT
jgi:hypothetical protein